MTPPASVPELGLVACLPATMEGLWTAITWTHDVAGLLVDRPGETAGAAPDGVVAACAVAAESLAESRPEALHPTDRPSSGARAEQWRGTRARQRTDERVHRPGRRPAGQRGRAPDPCRGPCGQPRRHRAVHRTQPGRGACRMSAQTTAVAATRRSSTTYAQLTERAARCIARARVSALDETPGAPGRTSRRCPRIAIWLLRSCTSEAPWPSRWAPDPPRPPDPGVEAPTPGCFARWRRSPGPATGLSQPRRTGQVQPCPRQQS